MLLPASVRLRDAGKRGPIIVGLEFESVRFLQVDARTRTRPNDGIVNISHRAHGVTTLGLGRAPWQSASLIVCNAEPESNAS